MNNKFFPLFALLAATFFWGISFPVMKALTYEEQYLFQSPNSFFTACSGLALRFGFAAFILLFLCLTTIAKFTKRELIHGIVLGLFIGSGSFFQLDGLSYTSASTSAFLTAFYAILVPIALSIYGRRLPPVRVWVCCILVIAGIAVLSGIHPGELNPGRGEWETLLASVFFTGQILWMVRIRPEQDNPLHITLVLTSVVAGINLVPALIMASSPIDLLIMHASLRAWILLATLAVLSTIVPFVLMNRFQPCVKPTVAGIIYCAEPVFATMLAAVLPAVLVRNASSYPNETLSVSLITGGVLITVANILVQFDHAPAVVSSST